MGPASDPNLRLKAIKGIEVMYKVTFATLLAASLLAAPLLQSIAFAQQPSASAKTAAPKKDPSAGQLAARERQKKCAAEWKETKAAGKAAKEATWPKFWSDCNKRLKAAAK
jgi:hypothetical protein